MALIDLKSDLSRYRSPASSDEVSVPNPTQKPVTDQITAYLNKTKHDDIKKPTPKSITSLLNTTYLDEIEQPIRTNVVTRLTTTNLDNIQKTVTASLFSKLGSTKLDDVVKLDPKRPKLVDRYASRKPADDSASYRSAPLNEQTSVLVNSVSNLSPLVTNTSTFSNPIPLEEITSALSTINVFDNTSNFQNPTDIKINKPIPGQNNNESSIDITRSVLSGDLEDTSPDITKNPREQSNNIVNPDVDIPIPEQSFNRQEQSVVINKDLLTPIGNITNPLIRIERKPLSINRESQAFEFNKSRVFPDDDIVNPEIEIIKPPQTFDRRSESPDIILDVPTQGIVVDPKTKVLRVDQSSIHFEDGSNLNIDKLPIRYTAVSELEKMVNEVIFAPIRYSGDSQLETDRSNLNLDVKPKTLLSGRHEDPSESNYAILGYQEVNFFTNRFATGFTHKQQIGDSKYIGDSQFSWVGPTESSPFTNFFSDANARGFRTFMDASETLYLTNSSLLGFFKPSGVNYFDVGKKNTTSGFSVSAMPSMTEYKTESSLLGWTGNKEAAPTVNYFDLGNPKTKDGFTKFHVLGDSKYISDSSDLNWDGNGQAAPSVNYFDLQGQHTTAGFHAYAGFLDSKYITDSSQFDWDGPVALTNAPTVNYFDMMNFHTTSGFTAFVQQGISNYVDGSSIFQWSGPSANAPAVDYFDIAYNFTDEGFHTFAQKGITKYIEDVSAYTWYGSREDVRGVNYFDLTKKNTTEGFHILATFGETKYIHESSFYTWKGNAQKPPVVNYFDLTNVVTTAGFHANAAFLETKYKKDASQFDWDGNRDAVPNVNYFDLNNTYTRVGFHSFAVIKDSKYISDSSLYTWKGLPQDSPTVNYFDQNNVFTSEGFHRFASLLESKYVKESSEFDWDGPKQNAPAVNYFDQNFTYTSDGFHILATPLESKYVEESSRFDWDGPKEKSPETDFFDRNKQFTTVGFHRLAEFKITKYVPESSEFTFKGKFPQTGIDYFPNQNQPGFTLNIFPKTQSKNPETEYLHETSDYTFTGERPSKPANWFDIETLNQSGFTQDIFPRTQSKNPETEYKHESSRFVWVGTFPKEPADWFDVSKRNQTGFTLNIMPKGESKNPNTEYFTESSDYGFTGIRPGSGINFFPDSNASGFTMDIFPKNVSQNPNTEYQWESSRFVWVGTLPKSGVDYFDKSKQNVTGGFTMNIFTLGGQRPLTTEYKHTTSQYTFATQFPAGENRFPDTDATGFKINVMPKGQSQRPPTEYIESSIDRSSGFIANGNRPKDSINFFPDSNASGFTMDRFPKGASRPLDDGEYIKESSLLDFNGILPPNKSHFWFDSAQTQEAGFLLQMNDGETIYPIISPRLKYNAGNTERLTTSAARLLSISTDDTTFQTYAPLSLGDRPWQNGKFATLLNQVPEIKTEGQVSSYKNKYDTLVSSFKDDMSNLKIYGDDKGNIDNEYEKGEYWSWGVDKPFIIRDIGDTYGTGTDLFEDVRDEDADRIQQWIDSTKGQKWITLQNELYKKNPYVDSLSFGSKPQTKIFNEDSIIDVIEGQDSDLKELIARHGDGDLDKYEEVAASMNPPKDDDMKFIPVGSDRPNVSDRFAYKKNRLIALVGEMLPSVLTPINKDKTSGKYTPLKDISSGDGKIYRVSDPENNSQLQIHRASHPYQENKRYNTMGVDITDENYPDTAKRHTFYGGSKRDNAGTAFDNTSTFDYSYYGRLKGLHNSIQDEGKKIDGLLTALSYLMGGAKLKGDTSNYTYENSILDIQPNSQKIIVEKLKGPVDPQYISLDDRIRAITYANFTPSGKKILNGPPSGEFADTAPEKQYSTVAYSKLKRVDAGVANRSRDYNDFRHDIENLSNTDKTKGTVPGLFSADPTIIDFANNNLETKYGFGKHGKVGADKSKPNVTNVTYEALSGGGGASAATPTPPMTQVKLKDPKKEFRGDRINLIDYKRKSTGLLTENEIYEINNNGLKGTKDLVTFYFSSARLVGGPLGPAEAIVFRATFDSISDNHKPSWSPVKYMGRGDPIYTYEGYERDVSFGFTVHIGSRDEMKATWRKLNYLASWTAPEYTGGGMMRAPICRLNIGHLYRKVPGFINSLSYTFDNVSNTWETAGLKDDMNTSGDFAPGVLQLPKTVQVSCGFTIFGVYRPEKNSVFYSLFDDDETGISPKNANKVNYFRAIEQGSGIGGSDPNDDYVAVPIGATDVPYGKQPALTTAQARAQAASDQASANAEIVALQRSDGLDGPEDFDGTGGTGGTLPSDVRLKKNIRPIEYGLSQVLKLNPVHYEMKSSGNGEVGFIAQELKSILPEVVLGKEGDIEKGEILTVSYGHMAAVLTKAIQEQQSILDYQSNRIDELETIIKQIIEKNE